MKKKVIINFIKFPNKSEISYYYKDAFSDLYFNFWIKTYCFIERKYLDLCEINLEYNEFWIFFEYYIDYNDFKSKIIDFEIIEMTTFTEELIPILIDFKKSYWLPYTKNKDLFRSKKLQRELLLNYDKNITVNYREFNSISDIKIEELEKEFSYPFIIKPISWIQSQLVYKVENREDFSNCVNSFINADKSHFNNLNKSKSDIKVLVEEFIDWEMYSIDYYVDNNWSLILSKPIMTLSWQKLLINDFFTYNTLGWKFIENGLFNYDLKWFVLKNVKATWILWNYVHHEFKLNSKWELKTIELNWRIWWFRLEMMKEWYEFNILRFMLWENMNNSENINNISVFAFYSNKRWILKWINLDLIEKVKSLKSFFSINIIEKNIWKKTWLTKDGFPKNMTIKLKNSNYEEFFVDVDFLKQNYFNFLIIE